MEIALVADSDFSDFDFDITSDMFREKLEYATAFSIGDLTSMCNILGLHRCQRETAMENHTILLLKHCHSTTWKQRKRKSRKKSQENANDEEVSNITTMSLINK